MDRLTTIARQTIEYVRAVNVEDSGKPTAGFYDPAGAVDRLKESLGKMKPAAIRMTSFLDSQPDETVRALQTLMYFGREVREGDDKNDDILDLHGHLATVTPDKSKAVEMMMEKSPVLEEYLEAGLARATARGVDLDVLLPTLN